jgi:hypothetical protein
VPNTTPHRLRRNLLEWRAEIEHALYTRRVAIAVLARRLGQSEELDHTLISLIFDFVIEELWIEAEVWNRLEQLADHGRA